MDIAGHVSERMLRHYSHIRMEAKRWALESIVKKQTNGVERQTEVSRPADEAKTVGYRAQRARMSIKVMRKAWALNTSSP